MDETRSLSILGLRNSVESSGKGRSLEGLKFGFNLVKGKANHPMKDYHVAKFMQTQEHEIGLFSIYDGHLGESVPAYLQKHLFFNILKEEEFWVDPHRSISKAYERIDQAILSNSDDLGLSFVLTITRYDLQANQKMLIDVLLKKLYLEIERMNDVALESSGGGPDTSHVIMYKKIQDLLQAFIIPSKVIMTTSQMNATNRAFFEEPQEQFSNANSSLSGVTPSFIYHTSSDIYVVDSDPDEISKLGTPRHKVHEREDGCSLKSDKALTNTTRNKYPHVSGSEIYTLDGHVRRLSMESVKSDLSSVRVDGIPNTDVGNSDLIFPRENLVIFPFDERKKLNRVLNTLEQRAATTRTNYRLASGELGGVKRY
ncbi:hypothetical protein ACFE04_017433 [Oxalis oulophora]